MKRRAYSLDSEPSDQVTMAVVQAVSGATNRSVTALPPLYDAIDPDALDALVESTTGRSSRLQIEFTYADCRVTVGPRRRVEVELVAD